MVKKNLTIEISKPKYEIEKPEIKSLKPLKLEIKSLKPLKPLKPMRPKQVNFTDIKI